jgi:hypothetical protein
MRRGAFWPPVLAAWAVLAGMVPSAAAAADAGSRSGIYPGTVAQVGQVPAGDAEDLVLGSYLGGSGDECTGLGSDCKVGIALGPDGSIYLAFPTESADMPTTPGAYDRTGGTQKCPVGPDCPDAFVARLDPTGSELIFATYLGGSGSDCILGCSLAVDGDGAAYLTGGTESDDFPTTIGAPDRICGTDGRCNFGDDGFAAKLSPDGSKLEWSTYLGGSDTDWGRKVVLSPLGSAFVVGSTFSDDFPTTPGAFDATFNGGYVDIFVTKVSPSGTAFGFSTYVGGSLGDEGVGLTLHRGSAYAVGYSNSFDFPTTPGAPDRTANGSYDSVLVRLDQNGSALGYGTYLGGSGVDCFEGCTVQVTADGSMIMAGATHSSNFPVTPGAFDTTFGGGSWCACDGFITKLPADSGPPIYSSYLGGSGVDFVHGMELGRGGTPTVVVETDSAGLFTSQGSYQRRNRGGFSDIYVATVNDDGTRLRFGTYLGGPGSECLTDCQLVMRPGPVAYVVADNRDGGFPTTSGAFQPESAGAIDAVVAQVRLDRG